MKSSQQNIFSALWIIVLTITMIPSSTEDSISIAYNSSLSPVRDPTGIRDPIKNVTVYPEGAVWNAELIQRVVTLAIIMVATLVGNMIILLVLSRSRYRKRSSRVNIFILNLAIGDLLVCLITMTSELLFEVFGEWVLGAAACKAIVYGQIVTLASTTFILTTMSYDRYQAICSPLRSTGGVKQAKRMIGASWILAFIFAIPQIFIFVQRENGITETGRVRYECVSRGYTAPWQRKVYFSWLTCYILIIPAACISYCYINVLRTVWAAGQESSRTTALNGYGCEDGCSMHSTIRLRRSFNAASTIPRAKIKTLKLTVCIIASFIICWTPYFIVHNIRIFSNYTVKIPRTVIIGAETFALLNSALNPIFYGYFNVRVRKGFIEIVYRKKDPTRERVCNGGLSGDTSYSSTALHQVPDRTTQQLVLEMSEYGTYYRPRRSPRAMRRKQQGEHAVARL
uniref:Putative cardioacceleratory peptide receptor n=1 Tax=Cupiennius salei TaxID=6928 RepID=A0A061QLF1_CUPSA